MRDDQFSRAAYRQMRLLEPLALELTPRLRAFTTNHQAPATIHILVTFAPSDSDGAAVRSLGEVLCRSVS
jgi:hypothetical protein